MADETTTTDTTTTADTGTTDAGTTQQTTTTELTAEQKTAAEAETARLAALTPEQRKAEETAATEKKAVETKTDTPADYTALKLPEGYKADDPVFADAVKLFGDQKISPEQAQKLIDFTVERDKAIAKAVNDSAAANWTKQTGEWRATSEKEFTAEALGDAKTALAQVFDKETVTYLESMGFTNHPGLIRGMVKVSQAIKDDTWVTGNAGAATGSDARKQFPNSNMNP